MIPEIVIVVLLVATNIWVDVGPRASHLVTGPLGAAGLLLAGRALGLSWEQLGLGLDHLAAGVVVGLAGAAVVILALGVGLALPATRTAFLDSRYDLSAGPALRTALVTIPLATVAFEETAFRSVLWGWLESRSGALSGALAATLVSSALFGLWHILPARHLATTSAAVRGSAAADPSDPSEPSGPSDPSDPSDPSEPSDSHHASGRRTVLAVLGAVAGTAVAGIVLAELRHLSGSIVAPALVHWAANGFAVVGSSIVWARRRAAAEVTREG